MGEIKIYGYARVSSKDQNEDRQRIALHEMGVPETNIYIDKQSGKDFERPAYRRSILKVLTVWEETMRKYRASGVF